MDYFITVETDLFEHREVKPHFINPCCFGEDFGAWLRQELLGQLGTDFLVSEITQEDYGWGFWARRGKDPFWIALSYVGDGPQEGPAQWMIRIECDYGLNLFKRLFHKPDRTALKRLREHVRRIIESNDAMKIVATGIPLMETL